jgi:hypothetical protein
MKRLDIKFVGEKKYNRLYCEGVKNLLTSF